MQDQPEGVGEDELRLVLERGWDLRPVELSYAPVGAGSYHWTARDAHGQRWFVTVDDLDAKGWLGSTRDGAYAGLGAALGTARWLKDAAGLGFVAAPEATAGAATVYRMSPRYAVAVYRYIEGSGWEFGQELPSPARDDLVDLLVALHRVTPGPHVPVARPGACWPGRPGPSVTCWPASTGWPRGWPGRRGSSPTVSRTRATSWAPPTACG